MSSATLPGSGLLKLAQPRITGILPALERRLVGRTDQRLLQGGLERGRDQPSVGAQSADGHSGGAKGGRGSQEIASREVVFHRKSLPGVGESGWVWQSGCVSPVV